MGQNANNCFQCFPVKDGQNQNQMLQLDKGIRKKDRKEKKHRKEEKVIQSTTSLFDNSSNLESQDTNDQLIKSKGPTTEPERIVVPQSSDLTRHTAFQQDNTFFGREMQQGREASQSMTHHYNQDFADEYLLTQENRSDITSVDASRMN